MDYSRMLSTGTEFPAGQYRAEPVYNARRHRMWYQKDAADKDGVKISRQINSTGYIRNYYLSDTIKPFFSRDISSPFVSRIPFIPPMRVWYTPIGFESPLSIKNITSGEERYVYCLLCCLICLQHLCLSSGRNAGRSLPVFTVSGYRRAVYRLPRLPVNGPARPEPFRFYYICQAALCGGNFIFITLYCLFLRAAAFCVNSYRCGNNEKRKMKTGKSAVALSATEGREPASAVWGCRVRAAIQYINH